LCVIVSCLTPATTTNTQHARRAAYFCALLHAAAPSSTHLVEPAKGRLVLFSSGQENLHQVQMVESGTRYDAAMQQC
jgi:hypothetical protein